MKKFLILLMIPMILVLSSCGNYTFQDDSFYQTIAKQIDVAFPQLSFTSANDLNTDTLYLFFNFFVRNNALYYNGEAFKKGKHYEIPISDIKNVLKDYLGVTSFDPNKLSKKELYDKEKEVIKTNTLSMFGGTRHVKLENKKYLGGNKVEVKIAFYDNQKKYLYSKTMIIYQKPDDQRYRIISIDNSNSK